MRGPPYSPLLRRRYRGPPALRCPGCEATVRPNAPGAIWCGWNEIGSLKDCQAGPPCPDEPCKGVSPLSGCATGEQCLNGSCVSCEDSCENQECGQNACANSCGTCLGSVYNGEIEFTMPAEACVEGLCTCTPSCVADELACGQDGCGGSCGECPEGVQWACGEERVCICSPQCSDRFCGNDSCEGSCGPMLESGTGAPFLAQGLNDCPENLLCDEELGTCGEGAFPCGSPFGLPLVPPEDLTASGTDTSGDLPVPLQEWITTQLTEGPPARMDVGRPFSSGMPCCSTRSLPKGMRMPHPSSTQTHGRPLLSLSTTVETRERRIGYSGTDCRVT